MTAVDSNSNFRPLGEVATNLHARPSINAVTVLAEISNALAPPIGFTEVWNDRGSGAHTEVRVIWMNPSSGYTCLGYVACDWIS